MQERLSLVKFAPFD